MISSIPKPDVLIRSLGRLIQSTKAVAVGALGVVLSATPFAEALTANSDALASVSSRSAKPNEDTSIRPFRVNIPQAALDDLRQRVRATRWPDRETVNDQSQGVQLATLQALVQYWGTHTTGARSKRS